MPYIKIKVDGASLPSAVFSISIPVTHFMSTDTVGLLNYNSWTAKASPGFLLINSSGVVTDFIEFGLNDTNYDLDAYRTSYYLATDLAGIIESASNTGILDATSTAVACTNCAKDNSWLQYKTGSAVPKVGETNIAGSPNPVFVFRSNCDGCAPWGSANYGTSLICGSWNFFAHASFTVGNNPASAHSNLAKIYYQNPTTPTKSRYCIYIPNIGQSTTCGGTYCHPSTGTSPTNNPDMDIVAFTVPVEGGLKWPLDMYSVMSETKATRYLKMTSLSYQFSTNTLTVNSKESTRDTAAWKIPLGYHSSYFGVNLTTSNDLPIGAVFYFGITAGCEFGLRFNGETNFPPCYIDNGGGYKTCQMTLRTGGIIVEIQNTIAKSPSTVTIKFYGVSCKTTIPAHTCNLQITSYLSKAMNALQKVDQTSVNLPIVFETSLTTGSGAIAIPNKGSDHYQASAKAILDIEVGITHRTFLYLTDQID
jgi:hypothetical protein